MTRPLLSLVLLVSAARLAPAAPGDEPTVTRAVGYTGPARPSSAEGWAAQAAALGDSVYTVTATADAHVGTCEHRRTSDGQSELLRVRTVAPTSEPAEGSVYAYDQSGIDADCGTDGANWQTYIEFDVSTFAAAAVDAATLRITPKRFPPNSVVKVYAPCAGAWHEKALTWNSRPTCAAMAVCTHSIRVYDSDKDYVPLECDITSAAVAAATDAQYDGKLTVLVDMPNQAGNSRQAVEIISRDWAGEDRGRRGSRGHHDVDARGGFGRGSTLHRGDVDTLKPNVLIESSSGAGTTADHLV